MVSFTCITKAQPTSYKCHLLSAGAVKMPFWCHHSDWHHSAVIDCRVHTVIRRKCKGQMDSSLSLKAIGVMDTVDAQSQTLHQPASHHFIQPVSLTSGLSVLETQINNNVCSQETDQTGSASISMVFVFLPSIISLNLFVLYLPAHC